MPRRSRISLRHPPLDTLRPGAWVALLGLAGIVSVSCAQPPHSEADDTNGTTPDETSGTTLDQTSGTVLDETTSEPTGETPDASTGGDLSSGESSESGSGSTSNATSSVEHTDPTHEPDSGTTNARLGDGELPGSGAAAGGGAFAPGTAAGEPSLGAPDAPADGVAVPLVPGGGDLSDGGAPAEPGTLTAGTWDDNLNFSFFLDYRESLQQSPVTADGYLNFSQAQHEAAFEQVELTSHQKLDIALVIDTTGSMTDELQYLQAEFLSISKRIETAYPNAEQRWSLIVYKDDTDEYVVRWFDFRDDADEFRSHLAAQSSGGGGDFPEASHVALATMNQLSWRNDVSTARLAFWVADAPHHAAHADAMKSAIEGARSQDIHLYPVASSGVDEMTELSMRSAAQLTGGRYIFLTDDSGVGNSHKEPTIPCYFVTLLDEVLLRMVDVEMTGLHTEPDANSIIRAVGEPQNGVCAAADAGPQVQVF